MLQEEFIARITTRLGLSPTLEQQNAMRVFASFLSMRTDRPVMIMRGSAGTGKTTLAAAMVQTMVSLQQKVVLMAPTGRAAKVFSISSGLSAWTIHRKIYRQKAFGASETQFNLNNNLHAHTLFIVDEASMISRGLGENTSLLQDLFDYVYGGNNCRLMLIGDSAQLPPVGEEESPALQNDVLHLMGAQVVDCTLDTVLRQSQESGILYNATRIRRLIADTRGLLMPRIRFKGFADIHVVPGNELIESLGTSYSRVGMDETMVVCRSNKRANIYNQGIRNTILGREEELCRGDWLMVVKNKYLQPQSATSQLSSIHFIANGDRAQVQRVRNIRQVYGFKFADVELRFPDYDNEEMETTILMDSLTSDAPALTSAQQQQLYEAIMEDYSDLQTKQERTQQLKQDVYYNALQVKFAYAVTCHKAQGGQWAHIYVDQGYMTDEMLTPEYIHWLYTAFTRATEHLFLVNWRDEQTEQNDMETQSDF